MASISLVKKGKAKVAGAAKAGDVIPNYILQDNEDGSFTVFGINAAGNQVDISAIATLDPPPTSGDTTILTVDPPAQMTVACHGLKVGHADVTVTATFTTGVGPFTITVPCDVNSSPVTGLGVTFGSPTIR